MFDNIEEILACLPQRYPFLMVDKILECSEGERISVAKNVSFNEPYFQGHFPSMPIMPGVMILEVMAQATGILAVKSSAKMLENSKVFYLVGVDEARFRRPVVPGDVLVIDAVFLKAKMQIAFVKAVAKVDGRVVATARFMCTQQELGNDT